MACTLSAWALHTLWRNVILIFIFICHSPFAIRYTPFAIRHVPFSFCHSPPSHFSCCCCRCSGAWARLLSLRFLAFVWLCCLRLCHFCRSCSRRRRHLNSSAFAFYLHLSTFCACYSFIGFDVSLAASKQKLKV